MKAGREDVGEGGPHPIRPCDEAFLRVVEVGSGLQIGEDHLRDPFIVLSVLPNGYPPIVPDRDNPLLGIDLDPNLVELWISPVLIDRVRDDLVEDLQKRGIPDDVLSDEVSELPDYKDIFLTGVRRANVHAWSKEN